LRNPCWHPTLPPEIPNPGVVGAVGGACKTCCWRRLPREETCFYALLCRNGASSHRQSPLRTMSLQAANLNCIPDAENITKVWSCAGANWLEQLTREAPTIFSTHPILLNIGANKGYSAPQFLNLWSQHRNATIRSWYGAIRDVARGKVAVSGEGHAARRHGFLATQMCGACGACRGSPQAPHSRNGGHVHLVEMTVANSLLLRHLANATNLQDLITVHNAAASNASGTIYSPRVTMGTEFATATSRANGAADRVDQVTVDAFLSSHQLPRVDRCVYGRCGGPRPARPRRHVSGAARQARHAARVRVSLEGFLVP
jgi:hypothetical protein